MQEPANSGECCGTSISYWILATDEKIGFNVCNYLFQAKSIDLRCNAVENRS